MRQMPRQARTHSTLANRSTESKTMPAKRRNRKVSPLLRARKTLAITKTTQLAARTGVSSLYELDKVAKINPKAIAFPVPQLRTANKRDRIAIAQANVPVP